MKAGRAITNRALRHTVRSIQKSALSAQAYGGLRLEAEIGTRIHERIRAMLDGVPPFDPADLMKRPKKCRHVDICPKQSLGRVWRNVPNPPRYEMKDGFFQRVFPAVKTSNELGYVIRHVGCSTGRPSTGINLMELPKVKVNMNKKERNEAIKELDSLESKVRTLETETSKTVSKGQAQLDKLEAALAKKRDALIEKRDAAVRPLRRRIAYLRSELAQSF